ncbi:ATP-binding protein [Streptomyces sp. JNUCC 64]
MNPPPVPEQRPPSGAGESFNPFGVPVTYERPGHPGLVRWEADAPLTPWWIRGHADLWVPVDHTEVLFKRFVERGPDPVVLSDSRNHGHVVVVSGAEGTGKTSLINRCVDDLARRLAPTAADVTVPGAAHGTEEGDGTALWLPRDGYPGVEIVPVGGFRNADNGFSRRNGRRSGVDELNRKIADRVLEKLSEDEEFWQGFDQRRTQADDLSYVYEDISRRLQFVRRILLVIVPDMRWLDNGLTTQFISSFHSWSQPSIVFFLETSHTALREELEKEFEGVHEPHLTLLEMGLVNVEDWDAFIARRTVVNGLPGDSITFADEVIQNRPERHLYRNVRQLQGFLHDMSDEAIRNHQAAVRMSLLRRFTERRSSVDLPALKF